MNKVNAGLFRFFVNFWPCIRGTGGRVIFVAKDFTKIVVQLKYNWRTRNAVNTIFGGSMYASTDPFFMLMFHRILGRDFVVWDKGCTIRFLRPAKETIEADFVITPEMIAEVKEQVAAKGECSLTWTVAYKNKSGVTFAEFDKVLYFASKDFYKQKLEKRKQRQKDAASS